MTRSGAAHGYICLQRHQDGMILFSGIFFLFFFYFFRVSFFSSFIIDGEKHNEKFFLGVNKLNLKDPIFFTLSPPSNLAVVTAVAVVGKGYAAGRCIIGTLLPSKIYLPSHFHHTAFIIEDVGLVITVMAAIRQERKDYLLHKSTTLETTM